MNKDFGCNRFQVDVSVLEDPRISWSAKGVYSAYCRAQQEKGISQPRLKDILPYAGKSSITATKSGIKELRTLGIIPEGTVKPQKPGYVYLFFRESTGLYKIGLSKTPQLRLKSLSSCLCEELILVWYYYVENMGESEDSLHDRFAHKRVKGEWFALDASDVEEIVRQKTS